jgi:hypothetical protein
MPQMANRLFVRCGVCAGPLVVTTQKTNGISILVERLKAG